MSAPALNGIGIDEFEVIDLIISKLQKLKGTISDENRINRMPGALFSIRVDRKDALDNIHKLLCSLYHPNTEAANVGGRIVPVNTVEVHVKHGDLPTKEGEG